MSDKKENEEPGLTTEEAKDLELNEQPKPTRHHSGHHSPPMSYNEEPGRDHKKRQRENEIARNKFSFTHQYFEMNKTLIIAGIVFVFATSIVVIGSGAIQSAQACPNTNSGTGAPNANQTTTNILNAQQPPSQLATGQA